MITCFGMKFIFKILFNDWNEKYESKHNCILFERLENGQILERYFFSRYRNIIYTRRNQQLLSVQRSKQGLQFELCLFIAQLSVHI